MKLRSLASALVCAHLLTACGGSEEADATQAAAAGTSLSGVASKGPLKKAVVTAYAIDASGVVSGTPLSSKVTDETGAYTLDLGPYAGTVQLVVSATADTKTADEATGLDVALPLEFKLHANTVVIPVVGGISKIQAASITPFTELAHNIAKDSGGATTINIGKANSMLFDLLGFDPVSTKPLDSTVSPAANATDAEKRYALFNAAVSKLASSPPTTADSVTRKCFTDAADNVGKKIQCATQQISTSVTVIPASGSNAPPPPAFNPKLAGFTAALVAAAADPKINKTGTVITAEDATVKDIKKTEDKAVEPQPIVGVTPAPSPSPPPTAVLTPSQQADVATAKAFVTRLRSNAAALKNGPLETGITDGVKAFGDSLQNEAAAVTRQTTDVVRLTDMALRLWVDYTTGAVTNPNSTAVNSFYGGCTVYEGSFPTEIGSANGAPYTASAVAASSSSGASWVGCSANLGDLKTDVTQYRQSVFFNMRQGQTRSAGLTSTLAAVPYIAVARKRYIEGSNTLQQNLTPTLRGVVGFVQTDGSLSGISMVGDLPPSLRADGGLLAARYAVNVNGQVSELASGAVQAAFSSGRLSVWPVGASAASLTLDLSAQGGSAVVIAADSSNAAQVAATRISLAASISTAQGELKGSLLADGFTTGPVGELVLGRLKFTGSLGAAAVAGAVGGSVGESTAPWLNGLLEITNTNINTNMNNKVRVLSFAGGMNLPQRPAATLNVSITETPATTSAPASYSLSGRYMQSTTTMQLSGTQNASGTTATFADASGVSVSVNSGATVANITVSGRQTAVIDKPKKRITYIDGSFESWI